MCGGGNAGQREPATSRRLVVLATLPNPVEFIAAAAGVWGRLGDVECTTTFCHIECFPFIMDFSSTSGRGISAVKGAGSGLGRHGWGWRGFREYVVVVDKVPKGIRHCRCSSWVEGGCCILG